MLKTRSSLGIALAALTAVISGVAVFLNGFGVRSWTGAGASTTSYTTAKNLIAALILIGLAAALGRRSTAVPLRALRGRKQAMLIAIAFVGGSVPFLLFFEGLSRASSSQAALLHKTLLVWVAILAVPLLGERITRWHGLALGVLVAGQVVLAGTIEEFAFGTGELMILVATLLWSIEVILVKRLAADAWAGSLAVVRMAGGAVVLVAFVVVTGRAGELFAMGRAEWGWAIIAGAILSGYVATWYFALSYAPAVDVTAVLVPAAVITALLNTSLRGTALPSPVGLALLLAGGALVVAGVLSRARTIVP